MYQFVVITLNSDRKKNIEYQFNALNIKNDNIYYMNAATIDNSKEYLPIEYSEEEKKIICCTRSHLYCLEYACLSSSPEYTIIIEDDVAFHRTQLVNAIEEIIQQWEDDKLTCGMVSLGWVPIETHTFYSQYKPITYLNYGENCKLLQIMNSGLQMYIVKKSRIKHIIPYLIYPTFLQLKKIIDKYTEKGNRINPMVADLFINVIISPYIVFPPLAIEQNISSSLNHNNWEKYWKPYFKSFPSRLNNYFFFDKSTINKIYN